MLTSPSYISLFTLCRYMSDEKDILDLCYAEKRQKHLLMVPGLRTVQLSNTDNGKENSTVRKKLYSCPADTALPQFAMETNLFVVGTARTT